MTDLSSQGYKDYPVIPDISPWAKESGVDAACQETLAKQGVSFKPTKWKMLVESTGTGWQGAPPVSLVIASGPINSWMRVPDDVDAGWYTDIEYTATAEVSVGSCWLYDSNDKPLFQVHFTGLTTTDTMEVSKDSTISFRVYLKFAETTAAFSLFRQTCCTLPEINAEYTDDPQDPFNGSNALLGIAHNKVIETTTFEHSNVGVLVNSPLTTAIVNIDFSEWPSLAVRRKDGSFSYIDTSCCKKIPPILIRHTTVGGHTNGVNQPLRQQYQ